MWEKQAFKKKYLKDIFSVYGTSSSIKILPFVCACTCHTKSIAILFVSHVRMN